MVVIVVVMVIPPAEVIAVVVMVETLAAAALLKFAADTLGPLTLPAVVPAPAIMIPVPIVVIQNVRGQCLMQPRGRNRRRCGLRS